MCSVRFVLRELAVEGLLGIAQGGFGVIPRLPGEEIDGNDALHRTARRRQPSARLVLCQTGQLDHHHGQLLQPFGVERRSVKCAS